MQSAFISYSTKDEAAVLPYEQHLTASGVQVWRDKSGLRQGQLWPMRLGEAIAAQDAVLLFWSANAAAAHFVTLEWNTALALQKPIIPVLLDDTLLPDVLRPYHGCSDIAQLREHLLLLSPSQVPPPESLLSELKSVQEDAGQALELVKQHVQHNIQQDNWRVSGNVYQVQGDLHVAAAEQEKLSGLSRWSLWLGMGAALLTIVALAFDIPEKFVKAFPGVISTQTHEMTTAGLVQDDKGNPLAGVRIQLPELSVETETNASGRFEFTVQAGQKKNSKIIAQKSGYTTRSDYIQLGNPAFNFSLKKE